MNDPMSDPFIQLLAKEIAARARVDISAVKRDAHLVLDLGLSSLDLLSVLAFAEQTLNARFPDELLSKLTTLAKIEEAVRAHRVSAAEGPAAREGTGTREGRGEEDE